MFADELGPRVPRRRHVREIREERFRHQGTGGRVQGHGDGGREEESRGRGPFDARGEGEQVLEALEGGFESFEREVEVHGPGDVDDEGTFPLQEREGRRAEAEIGAGEVAFEGEDFGLVVFGHGEVAGGEGGEDALERVGAPDGAVDFRDGGIGEELGEGVGADGAGGAGEELFMSQLFVSGFGLKERHQGGLVWQTAAFPQRFTTSPLTP